MTQKRIDPASPNEERPGSRTATVDLAGAERRKFFAVKRALDVAVSGAVLLAACPVMALTALMIRVESPGDPIFVQRRLGRHGQPFSMLKFRTMYAGSEAGGVYEAVADARVTRFGRFLRKTSLDELPQLVNILMGDMSMSAKVARG